MWWKGVKHPMIRYSNTSVSVTSIQFGINVIGGYIMVYKQQGFYTYQCSRGIQALNSSGLVVLTYVVYLTNSNVRVKCTDLVWEYFCI